MGLKTLKLRLFKSDLGHDWDLKLGLALVRKKGLKYFEVIFQTESELVCGHDLCSECV